RFSPPPTPPTHPYPLSLHDALPISAPAQLPLRCPRYLPPSNWATCTAVISPPCPIKDNNTPMMLNHAAPSMPMNRLSIMGVLLRSEEHTSELQSRGHLVCRLLLEKK